MTAFQPDIPPQVAEIIRHLPPDVKRGIRQALRALSVTLEAGEPVWSLVVAVCPRAHSVRMMPPLRHVLPGLPASFCQRGAIYIRPNGLSDSYTIFGTPPRHREGGR